MSKKLDGLDYWDAQARNSKKFNSFSKEKQKELRVQGYKNRGWKNVINSWSLLKVPPPISLSAYVTKKAMREVEKAELSGNPYAVLDALEKLVNAPDPELESLIAISHEH